MLRRRVIASLLGFVDRSRCLTSNRGSLRVDGVLVEVLQGRLCSLDQVTNAGLVRGGLVSPLSQACPKSLSNPRELTARSGYRPLVIIREEVNHALNSQPTRGSPAGHRAGRSDKAELAQDTGVLCAGARSQGRHAAGVGINALRPLRGRAPLEP